MNEQLKFGLFMTWNVCIVGCGWADQEFSLFFLIWEFRFWKVAHFTTSADQIVLKDEDLQ